MEKLIHETMGKRTWVIRDVLNFKVLSPKIFAQSIFDKQQVKKTSKQKYALKFPLP